MYCPACKKEISNNDLVCPSCKKVLKLQCPNCKAITKNNTCTKCGTVILNRCYKCGKLNPTSLNNCPKCGMDINASIALKESLIEEFAVLTVNFTNLDEIKAVLKSTKLVSKFKSNLYEIIKKNAVQKKLRVQILDDTYIIRFCKDYSFVESCKSAIDFSIFIAQTVAELNRKLIDAKGIELKVQMAVLKRDVYSKPDEYRSGLNINVVYSSNDSVRKFNSIEVALDSYIYQCTKNDYPMQSLSAVCIKNKMVMFFELVLSKLIKLEKEVKLEAEQVKLPQNLDYEPDVAYLNEQLINFKSLNCSFIYSQQTKLLDDLQKIASKQLKSFFVSVRSDDRLGKLYIVDKAKIKQLFPTKNVIRLTCSSLNKHNAYGLLKQLMLAYSKLCEMDLIASPSLIDDLFVQQKTKDLFKMETNEADYPEDFRYFYFEAFSSFFSSINQETLFVIDDISYSDDASIEILKYVYENFGLGNVSFLVSSNLEFALHRKICRFMMEPNYYDIEIMPSSNRKILDFCSKLFSNIKDTFFCEKILENTKGSLFYFTSALQYLTDAGVFEIKDGCYFIANEKMVIIPPDIDVLLQRRIKLLQYKENLFELYSVLILLGEQIPLSILNKLPFKDLSGLIKQLNATNLISIIDDKYIFISNYGIQYKNFLSTVDKECLTNISVLILELIYLNSPMPNVRKAMLLEYADLKKEAFAQWHSLAMLSSRFGDFCAYLNCTNKFLSLVENVIDSDSDTDKTVEDVKLDVYSELALVMYKFYPDKILSHLQTMLVDFEAKKDDEKVREISNKLVQSCLMSGYYHNALEYAGKMISKMPQSSLNPKSKDFDLSFFFINLITLDIYFNLGKFSECIELGNEIFEHLDIAEFKEKYLPENFSKQDFDNSMLDAKFFLCMSTVLKANFGATSKIVETMNSELTQYACFDLLLLLQEFLQGRDISAKLDLIINEKNISDKYSQILIPLLQAFSALQKQDYDSFGNYIYTAKVQADYFNFYQAKYFCDLMIAFAYHMLGNAKKAKQILYSVLDAVEERGIKLVNYLAIYLLAKFEFENNEKNISISILNNSLILNEQDQNISDIIIILFKILTAEIMITSGSSFEQALFSAEQAFDIALKNNYHIFINKIANILTYIYNVAITTNQDENVVAEFQAKFENLNNIIAHFNKN